MNKLILVFALILISCNEKGTIINQPTILDENAGFDLEEITFNEDVAKLFSKNPFSYSDVDFDRDTTKPIPDSIFKYKIESYLAETFKLTIPAKELGFLYKTREIDSLARIGNQYFDRLFVLTNLEKKPIAYYAESRFDSKKDRDAFIKNFKEMYGQTKYEFLIDSSFDNLSYQWDLDTRIIQIETSKGFSMSASSDGTSKSGEYYRLDVLIIDNAQKDAIYKAHILELPDKFNIKGKVDTNVSYTNLKELGLERTNIIEDEFLLHSYFEKYIKNEYGEYTMPDEEQLEK
ncbi:hypothetical protein FLAN108750_01135 [Flavobacterium antarcticum]|uniref:hypothetical protein n=1 Tax=Flavobacterium antarcticum TaxID=271155 RepID=UPI0003B7A05A|nr:hypothetical protein [Flavobacterium antarcticum]